MSLRWPGLPSECCLGVQTARDRPDPHQLSQQLRAQCCSRGGADADRQVSGQMRQVSWCPKSASDDRLCLVRFMDRCIRMAWVL